MMNIIIALLTLVLLLLALGASYEIIAAARDRRRYSDPPGERIAVNGHKLHYHLQGSEHSDVPTVILDAGVGGSSLDWSNTQPLIAEFAPVVSYDRGGYGWSDAGPEPRTPQRVVAELHTLLTNADIAPPYVLVGHSFGGMYMRLFAQMYPDEVVGLVLVDSSHPAMIAEQDTDAELRRLRNVNIFKRFGVVRLMLPRILWRANNFDDPDEKQRYLALTLQDSEKGIREAKPLFSDGIDLPESVEVPLIVLSRSESDDINAEAKWHSYQRKLAELSPDTRHIIAESGSHFLHLAAPETVANTVRELIDELTTTNANTDTTEETSL